MCVGGVRVCGGGGGVHVWGVYMCVCLWLGMGGCVGACMSLSVRAINLKLYYVVLHGHYRTLIFFLHLRFYHNTNSAIQV